jgi:hypothetical protein
MITSVRLVVALLKIAPPLVVHRAAVLDRQLRHGGVLAGLDVEARSFLLQSMITEPAVDPSPG